MELLLHLELEVGSSSLESQPTSLDQEKELVIDGVYQRRICLGAVLSGCTYFLKMAPIQFFSLVFCSNP